MSLEQWLNIIQTVALAVTLGVLIKYTIETKRLREATVKQNELRLRPCMTIYYDNKYLFKNIGHSPALNIKIDDLEIEKFIVRFERLSLLEPDKSKLLSFIKVGKEDHKGTVYERKYDFSEIAREFTLIIRYENIENTYYCSKVKVRPLAEDAKFLETSKKYVVSQN